ncbi:hypothetical protein DICPUDRAFT_73873 [Dictyostelium purpureum]|uniref:Uncharacterized protein n=1 Tax=Dictyostelium purpureum TaxID=5786 RepID=F0Z643_DICPU|nr:uncharacterized protein DICPUDRAFT_73873 [Dictyostelium purpureum]EGC40535.1 hypothetical protein DICPUDRAFT_73873 [Dictyostelium purpureum]|eukprot:XP_003282871.1 hypothetical protein DICPUDRAFT_73873 [Dictyostelium purpureum]
MNLDGESDPNKLSNYIQSYSKYSFYLTIKLDLLKYIQQKKNNDDLKKFIDEKVIEPNRLLSTDINNRVTFFDSPSPNHNLLLPIQTRIKLLESYKDKYDEKYKEEDTYLKKRFEDLIKGYQESIRFYVDEAIKLRNSEKRMNLYDSNVYLLSEDLEYREVALDTAYQIACYDKQEYDYVRKNLRGLSISSQLGGVYFKVDNDSRLLSPAKEDAVFRFYSLLYGLDQQLISPTQLLILSKIPILPSILSESPERKLMAKIKKENGFKSSRDVFILDPELKVKVDAAMLFERTLPIQGSLFKEGQTFEKFLEGIEANQASESLLGTINEYSFSSHVLASLLLLPTDYKPENLIIDNKMNIIGIDNDCCLESDEITIVNGTTFVNVKNILYFIDPLMNKQVNELSRSQFINQHPTLLILEWLSQLLEKENVYNQLVEKSLSTIYPHTPKANTCNLIKESLNLPLKFPVGFIDSLKERFIKIQKILIEKPETTHQELFKQIHRFASVYYDAVSKIYNNPLDRIASIKNNNKDENLKAYFSENSSKYQSFQTEMLQNKFLPTTPTITIKESIVNIVNNLKVADLISLKEEVFFQIIKLVIKLIKESKIIFQFKNLWNVCCQELLIMLMRNNAKEEVIQDFLVCFGINASQLNKDEHGKPKSLIHQIISRIQTASSKIKYIRMFVSMGLNIDVTENSLSPLDLVLCSDNKSEYIELFIELVKLGAGKTLNENKISKFYFSLTENEQKDLFKTMKSITNINPKVGWLLALNHLFPLAPIGANIDSVISEGHVFATSTRGTRIIREKHWGTIFDLNNNPIRINKYGKRTVPFIEDRGFKIYLKFEPQFPGTELAVSLLGQQLFGNYSTYSELAVINGFVVLLVQAAKGEPLYEFVEKNNGMSRLNLLNKSNISKQLIMEMLINNGDGNLGNYIIEEKQCGHRQSEENSYEYFIVPIDSDQSFMPPVTKEINGSFFDKKKLSLQVDTCLFLLDQMNDNVHKDVVLCLRDRDFATELKNWLDSLSSMHYTWIGFFKKLKIEGILGSQSIIGVLFVPGQIKHLFSKMVRLQNLIKKDITHMALLESLEPLVGKRYKPITQLKTISFLYRCKHFKNTKDESLLTSSSYLSDLVLESRDIPNVSTFKNQINSGRYGPKQAIEELNEIKREHHSIEQIIKDLSDVENPNTERIDNSIKLESLDNSITDVLLEKVLKQSNLEKLTPSQQKHLFKLIAKKEPINIYIRRTKTLISSILLTFNFNSVVVLDLSYSYQLTSIANGIIISSPIEMPCLKKIKMDHCNKLYYLKLKATCLEELSASYCIFKIFELDAPDITYMNLSNGSIQNIEILINGLKKFENLELLNIRENNFQGLDPSAYVTAKKILYLDIKEDDVENIPQILSFGYYGTNAELIGRILCKSSPITNSPVIGFTLAHMELGYKNSCNIYFITELYGYGREKMISFHKYYKFLATIMFFDPSNANFFNIVTNHYKSARDIFGDETKYILFGATIEHKEDCQEVLDFHKDNPNIKLIYSIGVDTADKEFNLKKELQDYIFKINYK